MKKILKWGAIGFVVLIVLGLIVGGGDEPAGDTGEVASETAETEPGGDGGGDRIAEEEPAEEPKAEEPAPEPEPEPQAEVVKVSAGAIVKQFEENELQADEKYKGKDLEVTGRVNGIDTEFLDDEKYYVALGKGKFDFLTVNCHDMPNEQLAKLKVGQTITVVGTFDDGGDLGVELKDCRLK